MILMHTHVGQHTYAHAAESSDQATVCVVQAIPTPLFPVPDSSLTQDVAHHLTRPAAQTGAQFTSHLTGNLAAFQSEIGTPAGFTADAAVARSTPDHVELWLTGDCVAITYPRHDEAQVHAVPATVYGVDAEAIYAVLLDQGIEQAPATLSAHNVAQMDLATTNTPVGRTRVTDYTDPTAVAEGGHLVSLARDAMESVVLLSPGASRMLAASGRTSPDDIRGFLQRAADDDPTAVQTRFTELFDWITAAQDADPERAELVRLTDVTGAAAVVLEL